jgi:hypothetical protein
LNSRHIPKSYLLFLFSNEKKKKVLPTNEKINKTIDLKLFQPHQKNKKSQAHETQPNPTPLL